MRTIVFSMLLLVGLSGGCSKDAQLEKTAAPTKLCIALNWIPDSQHGGFYAAEVHGYFQDEGLQVTILPGGPNAPVLQQVAMKRADFGVGNADQILMARQQEADVVAVLAAMQNSPRCIMVHEESQIQSFEQMGDTTRLAMGTGKAFAKFLATKVDLAHVSIVPYTGSIIPFLNDKSFAQQAYVFSEPHVAQTRGASVKTLMISELGFNPYSSCLFVHGDLIRNHPQVVEKIVRATKQGWNKYLQSPLDTNQRIQQDNPDMTIESLEFGAQAIRKLCLTNDVNEETLGSMKNERWRILADQLKSLGFLQTTEDFADAFDTRFLNAPES